MIVMGRGYLKTQDLIERGIKRCGENVMVHESCELVGAENISLGSNVRIDPWCILAATGGEITVGSYVHIAAYCYLGGGGGIELKDFAGLSQGARIHSVTDDYNGGGLTNPTVPARFLNVESAPVVLGRHVIVGSGSVILPGVSIADGSSVGALSIVKKSLEAWSVYAGCPARRVGPRRRDLIEQYEAELLQSGTSPPGRTNLPNRQPIVVVGAGGHAAVIIEAIRASDRYAPIAIVDPKPEAREVLGVPVVGDDTALPGLKAQGLGAAVAAIGDNELRQRLGANLIRLGFDLPTIIHPSALISPSATLGEGVVVMAGAHVGARARIGDLAVINTGAIVEHDNDIGAAAHVAPGVALAGCVRVGERTLVGIGSASRQGVRIGDDVVVGAGSAVIGDIPDGARVAGCPARRLVSGPPSAIDVQEPSA